MTENCVQILFPHFKFWTTAQKMKFSIKNFFSKCDQIRSFVSAAVLAAFTEEIPNGKLPFLRSEDCRINPFVPNALLLYPLLYRHVFRC